MELINGDTSIPTLLWLSKNQWDAGVDGKYAEFMEVMDSLGRGTGMCKASLAPSREELEAALRSIGHLRELSQRMIKEKLLVKAGIITSANVTAEGNLRAAGGNDWTTTLRRLISGWRGTKDGKPYSVPSPTSQATADGIWAVFDLDFVQELQTYAEDTPALEQRSIAMLAKLETPAEAQVVNSWALNQDVPGARANLASQQNMLIQKIAKDAALTVLGEDRLPQMLESLRSLKENHQVLINGRAGRRLSGNSSGYNSIIQTTELGHLAAMEQVQAKMGALEDLVNMMVAGDITFEALRNMSSVSTDIENEMVVASEEYSIMTQTTTKIPVNFMLPLPLTGYWPPGPTMQVATSVAIDIINQQQEMLVGYRIFGEFFDDGCSPDTGMRETLERFAQSNQWVGIGGIGCESVCKTLSVISASLYLPLLSFECSSGDELSDTSLYPNFIRLGTRRFEVSSAIEEMISMFKWKALVFVSVQDEGSRQQMAYQANALAAKSSISISEETVEPTLTDKVSVMQKIKGAKTRVIFFLGSEFEYRALICASHVANVFPGLTWLSEGVKHKAWWTSEDASTLEEEPRCTSDKVSELHQGALAFTGLGSPHPTLDTQDKELDCFKGFTTKTMHDLVQGYLSTGYPPGADNVTGVERPYEEVINFAIDGVCAFAHMVQYMLSRNYDIAELRTPTEPVYNAMVGYMRSRMRFRGASGDVEIMGNDLPGYLAIWQVETNNSNLVGLAAMDGDMNLSYASGLRNSSWTDAPADALPPEPESFPVLAVVVPALALVLCGVICAALYSSTRGARRSVTGKNNQV